MYNIIMKGIKFEWDFNKNEINKKNIKSRLKKHKLYFMMRKL